MNGKEFGRNQKIAGETPTRFTGAAQIGDLEQLARAAETLVIRGHSLSINFILLVFLSTPSATRFFELSPFKNYYTLRPFC